MHWLNEQIERLSALGRTAAGGADREPFLAAFREAIANIAASDAVTAAFGCHDGLVFAMAGRVPDPEALAAVAQSSLAAAKETALTADLGRPLQMVIIGREHKLALFPVGQMALGILARSSTNLSRALSMSPPPKEPETMRTSVLEEIGGREAVEIVVAMFYARILKDAELAPFFRGVSMSRMAQLQTEFLVAALEGKPWRGRDLKEVHGGMRISNRHFDLTANHLRHALDAAGVQKMHSTQILALVASLRSDIVAEHEGGPTAAENQHGPRRA